MPFIGMRELLNEPEEQISFVLEGRLPTGGDSLLIAKPKAGKSTLARDLAFCVARGEDFLGCKTTQGAVLYLAFEEKKPEIRRHFVAMGVSETDPIFVFCATSPADGLAQLKTATEKYKPVLIIVDTLFKLVRVKDGNDYAAVVTALEPLHALARISGAHVLAVHHAGKGDKDGGDSVLGSTAIFASVDTLLILKRSTKYRTLSSIQRYGTDMDEIVLDFNEQTRRVSAGVARADADVAEATKGIIEFLKTQSEPVEWKVIDDAVEGRKQTKLHAMKECMKAGTTNRTGNGKRGDPYLYSVSGSAGSTYKVGTPELQTLSDCNEKAICGSRVPVYVREPENRRNHK
jgi:hypothetical protein